MVPGCARGTRAPTASGFEGRGRERRSDLWFAHRSLRLLRGHCRRRGDLHGVRGPGWGQVQEKGHRDGAGLPARRGAFRHRCCSGRYLCPSLSQLSGQRQSVTGALQTRVVWMTDGDCGLREPEESTADRMREGRREHPLGSHTYKDEGRCVTSGQWKRSEGPLMLAATTLTRLGFGQSLCADRVPAVLQPVSG